MKRLVLILPILILLASGCTIPGGITIPGFGPSIVEYENDIVVIRELKTIPDSITEGQTSRVVAYVQNIGDTPISQAEVKLYDYCTGMLNLRGPSSHTIDILPKETKELDWLVEPVAGVKLQSVCELKIYVRYNYDKYEGLTTVHFINPDEMKAQLERGEFKEVTSYIAAGQGPIKAYLTVEDKQPIQAYSTDTETTLAFQIKNKGQGYLSGPGGRPVIPVSNIVIGNTQINQKFQQCFVQAGIENLTLIQRESSKIPCSVTLSDFGLTAPQQQVQKELTKQLTVKIKNYTYEFRASTKLTINPKI